MTGTISRLRFRALTNTHAEIFVFVFVLLFSYFLSTYYTGGDQVGYGAAYKVVRGVSPLTAFAFYQDFISTSEIGHYVVTYVFSNLSVEKNHAFSFLNALCAVVVFRALRSNGAGIYISITLIVSNYYLYVLWLSAERLKIAVLFLLCGLYVFKNTGQKAAFIIAAVISHLTVFLLIIGCGANMIINNFNKLKITKKYLFIIFIILSFIASIFINHFISYVEWKFRQYYAIENNAPTSIIPIIFYSTMSIVYAQNKKIAIIDFIPMFILFFLIGGSRINMLAYFIFLKYGLRYKGGMNFGVAITTLYFSLKTAPFLSNVVSSGQGF